MTHAELRPEARCLRLTWPDGSQDDFPFLWLRDNCASNRHPSTEERIFDLLSVPEDIAPVSTTVEADALRVDWPDGGPVSRFALDWLHAHRPGHRAEDPGAVPREAWRGNLTAEALPRADATTLMTDDAALAAWMRATRATGLSIVQGLPDDPQAGQDVARRISFLRETNFGVTFEVESKPDPNNSAYTADALPLHSDLPNQELPPGIQFLHCLANSAEGGDSVFADGLALAEDLAEADPDAFAVLSTVAVPFRFHDRDCDLRHRQKVLTLDSDGRFSEICWSNHLAAPLDMAPDTIRAYYRAWRALAALMRAPRYLLNLRLEAGEMAVFDNRRILHGRSAFDPSTGQRHLIGCYVDRAEFDSRLRVLARAGH
jgi:gamma-butyrobetaine dioxygenase